MGRHARLVKWRLLAAQWAWKLHDRMLLFPDTLQPTT
jgi:hypothetical protein